MSTADLHVDDLTDETKTVARVIERVEGLMGQPIDRGVRELVLDAAGQHTLIIPAWPLHDIEQVEVDGEQVDVEWSAAGWMRRTDGRCWPDGPRTVAITVDAGWDDVPGTLRQVILSAARRGLDNPNGYQTETITSYSYRIGGAPGAEMSTQELADVARFAIRR